MPNFEGHTDTGGLKYVVGPTLHVTELQPEHWQLRGNLSLHLESWYPMISYVDVVISYIDIMISYVSYHRFCHIISMYMISNMISYI